MFYKSKLVIGTIIFSISVAVNAGGSVGKAKISKIAFNSEHLFLYSDGWVNANSCENTTAVVLHKGSTNFERAYSMLLAAFLSGREVSAYSDGCVEWDEKTYNTIRGHKYLMVY